MISWGGGASPSEVADLYSKTANRMAEGGFKLRKWLTNDPSVRERIKKDLIDDVKCDPVTAENVTYAKSSLGLKMGSNGQKVLGLSWDFEEDTITLELTVIAERAKDLPATKRNTLRLLEGIFDPLGMIGPITITATILFQEACRQKINWDDPLDGVIKQGIEAWIESLIECEQIMTDRCVYGHVREEVLECSLHGFADAIE